MENRVIPDGRKRSFGPRWADSGMAALEAEMLESCHSLSIDNRLADLFPWKWKKHDDIQIAA